eukprot:PhF_6_TR36203/c0_g2_i5/m.52810/K00566/mnmA, trmU; tRNA-uridine 2-sulfurtransferase
MSNWDRHEEGTPCDRNAHDVAQICEKLNIPYHHVSFEEKYWCDVFEPTVSAYRSGYTLNPDVLCNQYIKFGAFHQYVRETLKVDLVATGHYAQVDGNGILHRAVCNHNDQSYFLARVAQPALRRHLFPLGHMTKKDVRMIASNLDFVRDLGIASKPTSTGLCFVGKRDWRLFLSEYIEEHSCGTSPKLCNRNGDELKNIEVVIPKRIQNTKQQSSHPHDGVSFYTLGQKVMVKHAAKTELQRFYICHKDISNNALWISPDYDDTMLYKTTIRLRDVQFLLHDEERNELFVQLRHHAELIPCTLVGSTCMLETAARAPTTGQLAVFYSYCKMRSFPSLCVGHTLRLVGSGWI